LYSENAQGEFCRYASLYKEACRASDWPKGTVSREFLLQIFFHESFSPKPLKFDFFAKIRGDIRKSRCTTGINDTGGKYKVNLRKKFIYLLTLQPKGVQKKQ
jgi:hypothetical protein